MREYGVAGGVHVGVPKEEFKVRVGRDRELEIRQEGIAVFQRKRTIGDRSRSSGFRYIDLPGSRIHTSSIAFQDQFCGKVAKTVVEVHSIGQGAGAAVPEIPIQGIIILRVGNENGLKRQTDRRRVLDGKGRDGTLYMDIIGAGHRIGASGRIGYL